MELERQAWEKEQDKTFESLLQEKIAYAQEVVLSYLPPCEGMQKTVLDAMAYSVGAGGKRLRPLLVHSLYELLGGQERICEPFMAAIEYIHTYSLIHDDLPAMDNDDLRRGKPTCHIQYGEDMAILAGDALLNFAYETGMGAFETYPAYGDRISKALRVLACKAGIFGMVGGQTVDVELEGQELTAGQLHMIYENKTGALLEASMMMGAILAGASDDVVKIVEDMASDIGIAFQIQDDILDVVGDEALLGKPIGSDDKNEKHTFVSLYGLETSRQKVEELTSHARELLQRIPTEEEGQKAFLSRLFDWLIHRRM